MARKVTEHGVEISKGGQGGNLQSVINGADLEEVVEFPNKGRAAKKGYYIDAVITLTQSITLVGDSASRTKITREGGLGPTFLIQPTVANQIFIIENFEFEGNMLSTSLDGGQPCILVSSSVPISPMSRFGNLYIHNYSGAGIKMQNPDCRVTIDRCHISGGTQGIYLTASSEYLDCTVSNTIIEHASFEGIFAGLSSNAANSGSLTLYNTCIRYSANGVNLNNVTLSGAFLNCYGNTLSSSFSGVGTIVQL